MKLETPWIQKALRQLRPPEKLTVSEWADKNRFLDAKSSNEPGRWKTSRTPYLKGIMDAFTDPAVEEIVFVKPTQVGGTECLLNMLGYIIDQDPSPTLAIYPSDNLAESISKNRIRTMIDKSPALAERYREKESKLLELQFSGMTLAMTGANSPSQLASRPIRFLLLDEVDKYPPRAGKEGDPISLARERTKTFAYNKKIFTTSTPTYKTGAIWQEFESCETQLFFYVPCPHCGEYQRLRFRQVKWDDGNGNPVEGVTARRDAAYYLCPYCGGRIVDAQKADMLRAGRWQQEQEGKTSRKKLGFHLNAIYSPWVTFGDVAAEWTKSQKDIDIRMNFINSWLGEPWEQVGTTAGAEKILEKQSRYTQGVVPEGTLMITGGVDKQVDCFYYTIRAWGANRVSWGIDHGRLESFGEVMEVFDRIYHDEQGGSYYVSFALMDSGNETDQVYDFCWLHQELFLPVKGSSTPIPSRFRMSVVDKTGSQANGMRLIVCDGGYYKDMIFNRINKESGENNTWFVYDGCDNEYAEQMTSEHKVYERVGSSQRWVWRPKMSGIDNHYLDCEVYATCAADVAGAFELLQEDDSPKGAEQDGQNAGNTAVEWRPEEEKSNGDYEDGSWIGSGGGWI